MLAKYEIYIQNTFMYLEDLGDESSHKYQLTFSGDEVETVGAVWRERLYWLKTKGNCGSMGEFDAYIANWGGANRSSKKSRIERAVKIFSAIEFASELEIFSERTDEAVGDLPEQTGIPPFRNRDISKRIQLGERALQLANEIRGQLNPGIDFEALESEFKGLDLSEE